MPENNLLNRKDF